VNSHTRRLMLAAAVLGFIARAAFGLIYWHDKPLTHDEREYLSLAANIATGRGFTSTLPVDDEEDAAASAATSGQQLQIQRFSRAPLYPLFLAPLTLTNADLREGRMPNDVPNAVKIAQAIVGAIGVWLIGMIAWRAAASSRAGVAAAAIASMYPPLMWICAYALSEALYSTLALACVWMLSGALDPRDVRERWSKRQTAAKPSTNHMQAQPPKAVTPAPQPPSASNPRHVLIGGVLAGLAILTRPAMLFFLPFALLLAWRRRPSPRLAVLLLAGTCIVVLPWTIRNAIVHGRFVLVASEGGVTFWTGNHVEARGEGDLAANPRLKQLNREFRIRHANLTEEELESIYYREALGFIAHDPIGWIGLLGRKLFYTVVPIGPSYRLHSPRYFWMSVIAYGAVLPFAVLGAVNLWRRGRRPWSLWGLAGSAVFVCLAFFPQERFRIPVIDPTLIVCAAAMTTRSAEAETTQP
jgi:4-amino-4-deoxy-L-arabinose transferase-like glycosyltransferase